MSMMLRVLAVLLLAAGAALTLPLHQASAATVNIAVSGTFGQYWFCNSAYQGGVCPTMVNVGDTVQWNFNGDAYSAHSTRHCSAGCTGSPTGGTPLWDSPIAAVQTYSYTFNTPGSYPYQCEVHPLDMQGEITVVAGGVGGETELADGVAAGLQSSNGSGSRLGLWLGLAAIAAGAVTLMSASWLARRALAARQP